MENTQVILVVSVGSSRIDVLEKDITAMEKSIAQAFPDAVQRRAFSSTKMIRKLQMQQNDCVDDVMQALQKLEKEGFQTVTIQPTYLIHGAEYEKICIQAKQFAKNMDIRMGKPLLSSIDDVKKVAKALMAEIAEPEEGEAVVWIGHGSEHDANASYALLEYMLHDMGWKQVYVGTVKGHPTASEVLRRLCTQKKIRHVHLHLLMVTAGVHAQKDIAAKTDSWYAQLKEAGFTVSCAMHGLGEYKSIQNLFIQHALEAKSILD